MKKFIVGLLFIPVMASAEFVNGNDLLKELQSSDPIRRGFVMGYIAGVADANNSITWCPPGGINLGQLRDMIEQYLVANASIRNLSGDVLIGDMLNRRWPCKREGQSRGT